jgi:hypothetical protein
MSRRILRPLWFVLALLFLIEAWLWDVIQPWIARLVRLLPYEALKAFLRRAVTRLPPFLVVFLFILPDALSYPVQFAALWIIAKGAVISGTILFVLAKVFGLGGTLLLFEVCHDKLNELAWFRWVSAQVARARHWANQQVEPARVVIRLWRAKITERLREMLGQGGFFAFARRLRANVARRLRRSGRSG